MRKEKHEESVSDWKRKMLERLLYLEIRRDEIFARDLHHLALQRQTPSHELSQPVHKIDMN